MRLALGLQLARQPGRGRGTTSHQPRVAQQNLQGRAKGRGMLVGCTRAQVTPATAWPRPRTTHNNPGENY